MQGKNISVMMMTALAMMPAGLDDTLFKKPVASGFKHQDLTNTSKQPVKSSYNSKQRKKSNRKGRG